MQDINKTAKELKTERDCSQIVAVFCLQNFICLHVIFAYQVFSDPTFSGIFVCGPLQSLVVYVCVLRLHATSDSDGGA